MNKKSRNLLLKSTISLFIIFLIQINIYSMVFHNWGECQFEPGCTSDPDPGAGEGGTPGVYFAADSRTIGVYLVMGAGHILSAQSGVAAYLNRVETASLYGTDFYGQREILYKVIMDMEMAKFTYEVVNQLAAATPYKKSAGEKLRAFDYETFGETEGLNPYIFGRVKKYLGKGDVRGLFARVSRDTESILDQLYALKETLEADRSPHIKAAWKLNQSFSDFLLFGQYAAQVFYETR